MNENKNETIIIWHERRKIEYHLEKKPEKKSWKKCFELCFTKIMRFGLRTIKNSAEIPLLSRTSENTLI